MRPAILAPSALAVALLSGCASVPCAPVSVVVARKEERTRLRTETLGYRTSETGRVVPEHRDVLVPEYWVRGADGRWYQLDEAAWRATEPGRTLSVCP